MNSSRLHAYLQRIDYRGPLEPSLATLNALISRHATAIPFENLDPFTGVTVSLDPLRLEQKLIHEGRGGYCFEQNLLLLSVLETVGFKAGGLVARVVWRQPEDAITSRGHMTIKVDLPDGAYLADVGFGGNSPTAAIPFDGREQTTPHEVVRLVRKSEEWLLQVQLHGEWLGLYRFDLQPQERIDYEAPNYYVATHPESHFVTQLVAAHPIAEGRYALRNRELTFHSLNGTTQSRMLDSTDEIINVLRNELGIRVPDSAALRTRIEALPR